MTTGFVDFDALKKSVSIVQPSKMFKRNQLPSQARPGP